MRCMESRAAQPGVHAEQAGACAVAAAHVRSKGTGRPLANCSPPGRLAPGVARPPVMSTAASDSLYSSSFREASSDQKEGSTQLCEGPSGHGRARRRSGRAQQQQGAARAARPVWAVAVPRGRALCCMRTRGRLRTSRAQNLRVSCCWDAMSMEARAIWHPHGVHAQSYDARRFLLASRCWGYGQEGTAHHRLGRVPTRCRHPAAGEQSCSPAPERCATPVAG
jgi:hypothetical protein